MKADDQHALREVIAGVAAKAHNGDECASLEPHVANGRAEQKVQHLERTFSVLVEEPRVGGSDIFFGQVQEEQPVTEGCVAKHMVKTDFEVEDGGVVKQSCSTSHSGKAAAATAAPLRILVDC